MIEINYLSAFVLGLMGAGHCLGMCGGIISSLSMASPISPWYKIFSYQIGRITSYTVFGLITGYLGAGVASLSPAPVLPVVSSILLILMGLYISRTWLGLSYLEKAGKLIWNRISPLSHHLLPVTNIRQALFLGALWGWLPCGLVYTSLGYALTLASPYESALFMLSFGMGTLPATLVAGAASSQLKTLLNQYWVRLITALVFIGFGVYTLMLTIQSGQPIHHH